MVCCQNKNVVLRCNISTWVWFLLEKIIFHRCFIFQACKLYGNILQGEIPPLLSACVDFGSYPLEATNFQENISFPSTNLPSFSFYSWINLTIWESAIKWYAWFSGQTVGFYMVTDWSPWKLFRDNQCERWIHKAIVGWGGKNIMLDSYAYTRV